MNLSLFVSQGVGVKENESCLASVFQSKAANELTLM